MCLLNYRRSYKSIPGIDPGISQYVIFGRHCSVTALFRGVATSPEGGGGGGGAWVARGTPFPRNLADQLTLFKLFKKVIYVSDITPRIMYFNYTGRRKTDCKKMSTLKILSICLFFLLIGK